MPGPYKTAVRCRGEACLARWGASGIRDGTIVANLWIDCAGLPAGPAAALAALHLTDPRIDALRQWPEREWPAILDYCDRARLTLALRDRLRESMPAAVQERVDT